MREFTNKELMQYLFDQGYSAEEIDESTLEMACCEIEYDVCEMLDVIEEMGREKDDYENLNYMEIKAAFDAANLERESIYEDWGISDDDDETFDGWDV